MGDSFTTSSRRCSAWVWPRGHVSPASTTAFCAGWSGRAMSFKRDAHRGAVQCAPQRHRDEHHDADDIARPDHPAESGRCEKSSMTARPRPRQNTRDLACRSRRPSAGSPGVQLALNSMMSPNTMMTASVASQLMSTCGQGPGLTRWQRTCGFFSGWSPSALPYRVSAQLARAACKVSARPALPGLQRYKRYSLGQSPAEPAVERALWPNSCRCPPEAFQTMICRATMPPSSQ